jgi:DNA-binding NarL/FixJ family response regulator
VRGNILLYNLNALLQDGLNSLFKSQNEFSLKIIRSSVEFELINSETILNSKVILFQTIELNESLRQAIIYFKTINPQIKVIALGQNYQKELLNSFNYSDVFLDAKVNFKTLLKAIQIALSDGFFIDPKATKDYINLLKSSEDRIINALTKREIEVLKLLCDDQTSKEIGKSMSISSRTVENHRKNLLLKTKSKGTAGLVIYAIQNNIISF